MEKRTIESLRAMICRELDEMAQKGILTHESLDILKDLTSSLKNLYKIEEHSEEEEAMGGYSQRSRGTYYVNGSYGRDGNSYRGMGMYDRGMGGNSYAEGNSYRYYDPYMDYPGYAMRGYSRTGSKEEMMQQLKQMMNETSDEKVKTALSEAINKMEK